MAPVTPPTQRSFQVNNIEPKKFQSNFIKTAKYNALDFLPKTILLQFLRYANIYFLVIAVLQSIPAVSPLNPFTAIAPFVLVLALSIIREGLEDLTRHRSDREANARKCIVYRNGAFVEQEWRNVFVGDIVITKESEFLPADLIIMSSSNANGLGFIETSSLDGEKNLKPRTALKETYDLYHIDKLTPNLSERFECIQPNPMLSSFDGTIIFSDGTKGIFNSKQLLYRGAKLKNTNWIVGVAVYTGNDTKVMKNSESAKVKQSKIEKLTNKLILFILCFQFIVCLTAAICTFVWNYNWVQNHVYIQEDTRSGLEAFLSFWSYFLLNNTMIPISLIVSLEFVKLIQAYFIERDTDLYNVKRQKGSTVFTSAINEELGQIEYLFSDKTGTLTCNEMEFKIAVIGDEMYGDTSILEKHQPKKVEDTPNPEAQNSSFADQRLDGLLKNKLNDKPVGMTMFTADQKKQVYQIAKQSDLANEYFTVLSTCHECLVERHPDMSLTYQGPSPDEVTLVDTANKIGYSYVAGSENNKKLKIFGQDKEFDVLHSFEFNSDRKRMSVIMKDSQGQIKLYIKGADSIIKNRLRHLDKQPFLKYIDQQLDIFAKKGLRTLLIGMKVLDAEEYRAFLQKYNAIADSAEKEKEIDRLADEIERDLYLIGATAVEDRLQDNVPETIYDLIKANIKVWMLTGDKLETAENIAKSCNLIQEDFQILQCSETTKETLQYVLAKHRKMHDYFMQHAIRKAMLIEGESLAIVLNDPTLTSLFLSITTACEAVVCCRVTPKQKADVVRLVKNHMKKITLAIGDGSNDVNMIQEAHIGVGLYGQEGMRAVQASDFALPEFQGLWKLLFVHGRWSYFRIADMILYFFYKNMIFTIPQFFFAFLSAYSSQSIFNDFYITTYNLIFTSLPLVIRAVTDQDVNYKELSKNGEIIISPYIKSNIPKLYYLGQQNRAFNPKKFVISVIEGLVHSGLIFTLTFISLNKNGLDTTGQTSDFCYLSITLYTSIIFIVDMRVATHTKFWSILTPITLVLLSLALYFAFMFGIDLVTNELIAQTTQMLFTSCHFYFIVFFNFGLVFMLDLGSVYLQKTYFGGLADNFRASVQSQKKKKTQITPSDSRTNLRDRHDIAKGIEIQVADLDPHPTPTPTTAQKTANQQPPSSNDTHESAEALLKVQNNHNHSALLGSPSGRVSPLGHTRNHLRDQSLVVTDNDPDRIDSDKRRNSRIKANGAPY